MGGAGGRGGLNQEGGKGVLLQKGGRELGWVGSFLTRLCFLLMTTGYTRTSPR